MKQRYAYIDLIKTIAIIMVIILHASLFTTDFIKLGTADSAIQYAIRIICEGVPLFIMVNGFLLLHKGNFDLKKHLKKTLKIFLLLIIWSIIVYVVKVMMIYGKISPILLWQNIWTTGTNNIYTGMFWFLQNLITLYLMYPIIKNIYDNNKQLYKYVFIIVIISSVGIRFLQMITQLIESKNLNLIINYITKFNIFLNRDFLLFFMIGGYLYENKEMFTIKNTRNKYIIIGILSWGLSFLYAYIMSVKNNETYPNNFNCSSIFMVFIMIGIFAISNMYKDNGRIYNKIITSIGKNSLGIYFIHIIILDIISKYLPILNSTKILICIKILITVIASWGLTLGLGKIPKLKELVKI